VAFCESESDFAFFQIALIRHDIKAAKGRLDVFFS